MRDLHLSDEDNDTVDADSKIGEQEMNDHIDLHENREQDGDAELEGDFQTGMNDDLQRQVYW